MCGRYSLTSPPEAMKRLFDLETTPNLPPRYNIAPTQIAPVVRHSQGTTKRELAQLRWGLVPSWAKDLSIGAKLINARGETVAEKPSFRAAFRQRRCLVAADGFYEWKTEGKAKQPMRVTLKDGGPFAFAGLWECFEPGPEGPFESFTIITTDAAPLIRPIHDRMPVMLDTADYDSWLDPAAKPDLLSALLRPFPSERLKVDAVSTRVNASRHDDAFCVAPLAEPVKLL
ncbi:MAG: SOS response-associated peptidase [Alphaproteobacteria bacterium]|nr:SOS response-associated peptidase [Alphaproteobacteria bacterium]